MQTRDRAGDGQTGRQHNLRHTLIGGVVGGFAILSGLTCLLITPREEDSIVGTGGDAHRYQEIDDERGQADDPVHAEEGDKTAGDLQLDTDGEQQDDDGDDRSVEQEQHQEDHPDAHQGDEDDRTVSTLGHVRDDGRWSRDIGLDARR
ncbi:Uncharacterised protein [Mycobacteroides abscessus subsp. abscessus]|nr:Uncharacterised protein [Mycobacteroides abscessus subsp. abscessus]